MSVCMVRLVSFDCANAAIDVPACAAGRLRYSVGKTVGCEDGCGRKYRETLVVKEIGTIFGDKLRVYVDKYYHPWDIGDMLVFET